MNQLQGVALFCFIELVDEDDLARLGKCSKLNKLVIFGTEWKSLDIKGGLFNTLIELDISRFLFVFCFMFRSTDYTIVYCR